jgi:hypothetical protein
VSETRDHPATVLYGGLWVDQAKRLKPSEQENARLKRIIADEAVDLSVLKEVVSGTC